jgi:hypothetical protein
VTAFFPPFDFDKANRDWFRPVLAKANPNHDELGRFAAGSGAASGRFPALGGKMPEFDEDVTDEVMNALPSEARTPDGAESYYYNMLTGLAKSNGGSLPLYHETFATNAGAIKAHGLSGEETFAAVAAPSNFIIPSTKAIVRFDVPVSAIKNIVPDTGGLAKLTAHQFALLEHPDLVGSHVAYTDAVPRSWIKDVQLTKANPNHDELGRFASAPADGGLKQYLQMVTQFDGNRPSAMKFVLEHGQAYKTDDHTYLGGEVHECYKNAALASFSQSHKDLPEKDEGHLTYVEGFVSVYGVPIAHAWTVNQDGVVRDVTLTDNKGVKGYFGVPIKQNYLQKTLVKNKYYGILTGQDNPKALARLLKDDPKDIVA